MGSAQKEINEMGNMPLRRSMAARHDHRAIETDCGESVHIGTNSDKRMI
jgi:hypothetical protein